MQEENFDFMNFSQNINTNDYQNSYFLKPNRYNESNYNQVHNNYKMQVCEEENFNNVDRISKTKTREKQDFKEKKSETSVFEKSLESVFEQEKVFRTVEIEIKLAELKKEMLTRDIEKSRNII